MSTVTTVLAANAAIQSSVAAQQASEANTTACMAYMSGFTGKGASAQEAAKYSECVAQVYPPATEFSIDIPSKAIVFTLLLAALISVIVGIVQRFNRGRFYGADWFEICFFYPIFGCVICGMGWLIYTGILYLLY